MKTVEVKIQGITSLLINRFKESDEQAGPVRPIKANRRDPRAEATEAAYIRPDGTYYFSGASIPGTMGVVGANHKSRGSRKSLRFVVPAAVRMTQDDITIMNCDGPAKNFEVDSRPVTIPATKGRIMRHRPRFDNWTATFDLVVNEDLLALETVHQLLNEAGLQSGIGDYRPSTKGPFGTFRVVEFKEKWEPKEAKVPSKI